MVHIAGNPALDLVGTVSVSEARATSRRLDMAPPWPAGTSRRVSSTRRPAVNRVRPGAARNLREHLFEVVSALADRHGHARTEPAGAEPRRRRQAPITGIGPDGRRFRHGDATACLAAVAQAAVDLVDPSDGALLRLCADDLCTHPFLDRSRAKARRWCDMETCGDRAKVRRYRQAQKAAVQGRQ